MAVTAPITGKLELELRTVGVNVSLVKVLLDPDECPAPALSPLFHDGPVFIAPDMRVKFFARRSVPATR